MWQLYKLELKYEVFTNLNHISYLLKKIPFLRSRLTDQYACRGLKTVISALSGLYKLLKSVIFGILLAFLAFFIFNGMADLAAFPSDRAGTLVSFLLTVYLVMNNLSARTLSAMQKMYLFHTVFRHSAQRVARIELLLEPFMSFLGRSAGFALIFLLFTKQPLRLALLLSFVILALSSLGEWIHLRLFQRGLPLQKNTGFLAAMLLLLGSLLGSLAVFQWDLTPMLDHPAVFAGTALLWLLTLWANWHYSGYTLVAQYVHIEYEKQLSLIRGNPRSLDVRLKDTDHSPTGAVIGDARLSGRRGYEKLNALFFQRHKRILRKPVLIFTLLAAAVGLAGLVTLSLNRVYSFMDPAAVGRTIDGVASVLPFFLYLSIGDKRLTKALFVNCDASLMSYSFYRTPEAILANYRIRLKHVIRLNLPPTLALLVSLAIWLFFSGASITLDRLILFPMIIAYFVFFTIHLLFVYYILQPYTLDLTVRSPLYKVIDFVVYLFCYLPMFLKPDMTIHALLIIVLTMVYATAARIILPKKAPQTFHLR